MNWNKCCKSNNENTMVSFLYLWIFTLLSGHAIALTTKAVCNGGTLKVYADGILVGSHEDSGSDIGTFTHDDNTQMVGLECETTADIGGILAEVGDDYFTDATWHCWNSFQSGWSELSFDDSTWPYATTVSENDGSSHLSQRNQITSDVKWIWTSAYDGGDQRVFCRGIVNDNGAPDNAGRKFVIGYMVNINHPETNPLLDVDLFISTSSATQVSVRVTTPAYSSNPINEAFTITAGEVQRVVVPGELISDSAEASTKAIQITATDEVVAYGVNKQTSSTDAFLALPMDAVGNEYYVMTWEHDSSDIHNQETNFLIVGAEDGTTVNINPSSDVTNGLFKPDGTSVVTGTSFTVTLDKYDTYSCYSYDDLTGTHITSNHNIMLYSGNKRTPVTWPLGDGSRDNVVEQIPDVRRWGKKFVLTPIPSRDTGDEYKILASEDDTTVIVRDGDTVLDTIVINLAGGFALFHAAAGSTATVVSDKPILIGQFQQSMTGSAGDPTMQIIPPVYLFVPDVTFAPPQSVASTYTHYITVVVKESQREGLRHNGEAIDQALFSVVSESATYIGDEFSVATFQVDGSGTHRINHISTAVSFGAFLYGFAQRETYAAPAGYRLSPINQECVVSEGSDGDGLDNDCDGYIDEDDCSSAPGTDCARPPPIDGMWSDWTAWGSCAECGTASTQTRRRTCSNPVPQYNGLACSTEEGGSSESQDCNVPCLPVDGGFTEWSAWSECDVTTCTMERSRECTDPTPEYGGADCTGDRLESMQCETCERCLTGSRTQCSDDAQGQEICENLGCCWEGSATPNCFHSTDLPTSQDESVSCSVPLENREDCGHDGITRDECLNNDGCCWYTLDEGPWCYTGEGNEEENQDGEAGQSDQQRRSKNDNDDNILDPNNHSTFLPIVGGAVALCAAGVGGTCFILAARRRRKRKEEEEKRQENEENEMPSEDHVNDVNDVPEAPGQYAKKNPHVAVAWHA